ncbi:methylated-DNA--[protein]-cysteine S-methyltransferase [Desulfurobacterium sp.]
MVTTIRFSFGITAIVKHFKDTVIEVKLTTTPAITGGNPLIIKFFKNYEKEGTINIKFEKELLSPFQKKVFSEISAIPPGKTATYGEIASKLKTSPRAVGQALKRNPFPLIIPCHRIVGAKDLGGFSEGTEIKKLLLDFERQTFTR